MTHRRNLWSGLVGMACAVSACGGKPPADLVTPGGTSFDLPPGALAADPTRTLVQLVDLDAKAFDAEHLRIGVAGKMSFVFDRQTTDRRPSGDLVWRGATGRGDRGVFVVHGRSIAGTFAWGGNTYQLVPLANNMHAIVQLSYAAFPPDHPAEFRAIEAKARAPLPPVGNERFDAEEPPTIEILVAYTPAVASAWTDPEGMIRLAVAEANSANANSEVGARFHLAHVEATTYTESGDWQKDLDRLSGKTDGFMDDLHQLRDEHHADIVVLIVNNPTACGYSGAILADASTAFSLVHYKCATGYYAFAHEIGHLMGARHDTNADATETPYKHGHGFQHLTANNNDNPWRTVMAYDCPGGCVRLGYWSNPNVPYYGVRMGTDKLNNVAKVLNATARTIAGFRN